MSGDPRPHKVVFVSSTVYHLERERSFIKPVLEDFHGPVRFTALLSEDPSFPLTPIDLATKHSYGICLDKIVQADYFILLVKKRYGARNVQDGDDLISITHREYREAYRRHLPIFSFVDKRTWDAKNRYEKGGVQGFIPEGHLPVFDFIDEIRKQPRSMWLYFYRDLRDIRVVLETALFHFDDSVFSADLTIPDGTILKTGARFDKVWEIRNNGCVVWEGRFLQEDNPGASGLIPEVSKVPIPRTEPGATAKLCVTFTAPDYPGTCESYWKMVDARGRYLFPQKKGLFCRVKVVY